MDTIETKICQVNKEEKFNIKILKIEICDAQSRQKEFGMIKLDDGTILYIE